MTKVGVIGMGMMGSTHLDAYNNLDKAEVVAVSDANPKRLAGEEAAGGNVEGQAQGGIDLSKAKKYAEGMELIADPDVELVDICLITPLHLEYALAAFKAGKHVLIEKPLARTYADGQKIVEASKNAEGLSMCAMCMRFWPGWVWLKKAVDEKTFGKVLSAQFRRVASHPDGGKRGFYSDGQACGGALLDLHIHDADFVHYCFGMPAGVSSRGYTKITGEIDHVVTQYLYNDGPMVFAEGGWAMSDSFGFEMAYTINFENATVIFSFDGTDHVKVCENGKEPYEAEVGEGMGYFHELAYLLDCIEKGEQPTTVTLEQAAETLRLVEAERQSIATGQTVSL